jgi:hypothetical protein
MENVSAEIVFLTTGSVTHWPYLPKTHADQLWLCSDPVKPIFHAPPLSLSLSLSLSPSASPAKLHLILAPSLIMESRRLSSSVVCATLAQNYFSK